MKPQLSAYYSILYQKLGGHTVLGIQLLYCTRLLGTYGYLVGSGEKNVSGNLPIESGRAQDCFFLGKMAISDSGSQFLDSGSPPRSLGRAQGCFFYEKWQSGILEAISGILEALREHQGVLKAVFLWGGNGNL